MDMSTLMIMQANQQAAAADAARQEELRKLQTDNEAGRKSWAESLVKRGDEWLNRANAVNPTYAPLAGGDYDRLEAAYKQPGELAANQGYQVASRDMNQVMGGRGLYGSSLMTTAANEGLNREYMNSLATNASQATLNRYGTQQDENRFVYGTQKDAQNRKDNWAQNFLNAGNGQIAQGFDATGNMLGNWLNMQNSNAQAGASRFAQGVGNYNQMNMQNIQQQQAAKQASQARSSASTNGLLSLGGTVLGAGLGFAAGGPMGAGMGASLGGSLGGAAGGGGRSSFGSFPGASNAQGYLKSSGWGGW